MLNNLLLYIFQWIPLGYCIFWKDEDWLVLKVSFFRKPLQEWLEKEKAKPNSVFRGHLQLLPLKQAIRRINFLQTGESKQHLRFRITLRGRYNITS